MSKDTTDDETLRQEIHEKIYYGLSMAEAEAYTNEFMQLIARHVQAAIIDELQSLYNYSTSGTRVKTLLGNRMTELQAQPLTDKDSV